MPDDDDPYSDRRSGERPRPTCPVCRSRDDVDRDGNPAIERPWYCGRCGTVFAGTDEEWRRFTRARRQRDAMTDDGKIGQEALKFGADPADT